MPPFRPSSWHTLRVQDTPHAGGRDYLLCFLQAKSITERPLYGSVQLPEFKYTKS